MCVRERNRKKERKKRKYLERKRDFLKNCEIFSITWRAGKGRVHHIHTNITTLSLPPSLILCFCFSSSLSQNFLPLVQLVRWWFDETKEMMILPLFQREREKMKEGEKETRESDQFFDDLTQPHFSSIFINMSLFLSSHFLFLSLSFFFSLLPKVVKERERFSICLSRLTRLGNSSHSSPFPLFSFHSPSLFLFP